MNLYESPPRYDPPPPPPSGMPRREDISHLDTLAVVHYVVGGIFVFISCLPLLYLLLGTILVTGGAAAAASEAARHAHGGMGADPAQFALVPAALGGFFMVIFGLAALFNAAIGVGIILSGRFLRQQRNYIYSFVVACLMCLSVPLGTILGVFTIIVLSRESVKRLYGRTF
ncbi:hypothetical protein H5P28_17380 [Ruficoccus amylovorans]|uniref:Uncharacterized protein n=1 Tax=Ruficoccus amylovorans TaxID=1804625 RepID=A0A842HI07_9BACT|nr:hypothetical protein [Ruficoccus amylovorans]MBC2596042.1 hypothetical protein [Ruficoccus amylovorans]